MPKFTRRRFITASSVVVTAALLGRYSYKELASKISSDSDLDFNIKKLSKIGQVYMDKYKLENNEATKKALLSKLFATSENDIDPLSPAFADHFSSLIETDIEKQRICDIKGWQLTKSECLLGALAFIEFGVVEKIKYSRIPQDLPERQIAKIENWGPRKTSSSKSFNRQSNGNSALWVKTSGLSGITYDIYFGTILSKTTVHKNGLLTADLTPIESVNATKQPGDIGIFLVDTRRKTKQKIGMFKVTEIEAVKGGTEDYLPCYQQVEGNELAEIIAWGPQKTIKGKNFNMQLNGDSAFWVKTHKKNKADYQLALGDMLLKTHNIPKLDHVLLTGSLKDYITTALVNQSEQVPLFVVFDNKKQLIGQFIVN